MKKVTLLAKKDCRCQCVKDCSYKYCCCCCNCKNKEGAEEIKN